MCDTLIALGNSTEDGSVIFGKNSDRPQDEAQLITHAPRTRYSKGEEVKCTYISIPQVSETNAILLSQPWWMWGAESGGNEHGVVIGNEAVYSLEPLRNTGLLGMDLLRLGLERGKTAKEAMNVITELLERYGQGGGCAYGDSSWMYHNSFIIADPVEAYVLETADEWWIVEKIKDVRSISNGITIRGKGDNRKDGIIQHAMEKGYCKDDNDFDFASTFSGSHLPDTPSIYSRGGKTTFLLTENKGKIVPGMMMNFLREHQAGICMHGGFESTGSQVSHLRKGESSIHWLTGSTLPCLSIYKPYVFPVEGQEVLKSGPYSKKNPQWFWYKHASSKPQNKIKQLRIIENNIISKVNEIILQENKITEEDYFNKVKAINLEAWEKSKDIVSH